MLSSVDENGVVPDAEVIVAGFGLLPVDEELLKDGAGRLADNLRIVNFTETALGKAGQALGRYPISALGCLLLPGEVTSCSARILTLDSDIIANHSLRSLLEMDLQGCVLAAVHDVPRADDLDYFNSGVMLIDVDAYQQRDIARQSLRWLAEHPGEALYADQDALNGVLGGRWQRLPRSWNFFQHGDEPRHHLGDFMAANIVHFAGPKPWKYKDLPAGQLYEVQRQKLEAKSVRRQARGRPVDREFVASAYEILLGRELEASQVVRDRAHWAPVAVVRSITESEEFRNKVFAPLASGSAFAPGLFARTPTLRQRFWAADRLPLSTKAIAAAEVASTWRELLSVILQDERFSIETGAGLLNVHKQEPPPELLPVPWTPVKLPALAARSPWG